MTLPDRSRLYHLAPIGINTGMVESLSSYILRLAHEHNTAVRDFASGVICTDHRYASYPKKIGSLALTANTGRINHPLPIIRVVTEILSDLTCQRYMDRLTLLPWEMLYLSNHGLLRQNKAWCPACLKEMRKKKNIKVYDPLLWFFTTVNACHLHGCHLVERCPNPKCGAIQPVIDRKMLPGYCVKCYAWLGDAQPIIIQEKDDALGLLWKAKATYELLTFIISVEKSGEFEQQIRRINKNLHILGNMWTNWRKPKLDWVLNFGYRLQVPVLECLLFKRDIRSLNPIPRANISDSIDDAILAAINQNLIDTKTGQLKPVQLARLLGVQCEAFRKFSFYHLRPSYDKYIKQRVENIIERFHSTLEAALTEVPPPSLDEVARLAGTNSEKICQLFPELSSQVINRRNNSIEDTLLIKADRDD